jgi:hypothetical protein
MAKMGHVEMHLVGLSSGPAKLISIQGHLGSKAYIIHLPRHKADMV